MVTNLTVEFVGILLLPSKVHADDINDLQYLGAKMATKSERMVKYGHRVSFREIQVQTQIQEKHKKHKTKMVNFQDAFTNLDKGFFVLS